jgi:hypothetical protein
MRRRALVKTKTDSLKRKAWDTFSKWVRERDKKCVTCGSINQLQGGHFWHGVLDFDEINVNAQCKRCNVWLSGNLAMYSTYLIEKYGIKAFEDLKIRHYRAMKGIKMNELDYERIINHYTRKLG